jgi:hypothetical protein
MVLSAQDLNGVKPLLSRAAQPIGEIVSGRLFFQPEFSDDLLDHR